MSHTYNFEIDTDFYPMDAIYSVAYLLLEKYYLKLISGSKNSVIMAITTEQKLSKPEIDGMMRRIEQELINQTLRLRVAKENQKLREYILGKALFGAQFGVIEQEDTARGSDGSDYINDPLGIAVPWEKKHRTDSKSIDKKKSSKTTKNAKVR